MKYLAMYIRLVCVPVLGTYVMFLALIWFVASIFIFFGSLFTINRLSNTLSGYGYVLLLFTVLMFGVISVTRLAGIHGEEPMLGMSMGMAKKWPFNSLFHHAVVVCVVSCVCTNIVSICICIYCACISADKSGTFLAATVA